MKQNGSPRLSVNAISVTLFIFSLILFSSVSYSQAPANFSGVWVQDTSKSDDFYKKIDVKYSITQTAQTFNVKQILSIGTESVTRDYSYTLDGKVTNTKKETGTEKNLAQWSADKKILKTRSTITYGPQDVGFTETYSLSDNGLVLTVQKSDIIEGALSVKQVFNKKQ